MAIVHRAQQELAGRATQTELHDSRGCGDTMKKRMIRLWFKLTWLLMATLLLGCSEQQEAFSDLEQLHNRTFAVPTGTIADQLVL